MSEYIKNGVVKIKALIFGGTGYIGRNLINQLAENNFTIHVVTRKINNIANFPLKGINVIELKDLWSNGEVTKDIDVVINLAGASINGKRWTESYKKEILHSRINITREIVQNINLGIISPKLLINASATGYYGSEEDKILYEHSAPGSDFLAKVCIAWEKEAYEAKNTIARVVTLRTGIVLGTEGALSKMLLPFKMFIGGAMGGGEQWFSWIHIHDLCSIINFIIHNDDLTGAINAVAPTPVRNAELSKILGNVIKRPSLLKVPKFILKIVLGEMSALLLNSQRVQPAVLLKHSFKFNYPDLKSALMSILNKPYY